MTGIVQRLRLGSGLRLGCGLRPLRLRLRLRPRFRQRHSAAQRATAHGDQAAHAARRRGTLAQRVALLTTAVAVLTALVAGVLGAGLIQRANETSARRTLARLADVAKATADQGVRPDASQSRARRTLDAIGIVSAGVGLSGVIRSDRPLARQALTRADVAALLAGRRVTGLRDANGRAAYVEGRPTRAGGIVLVQRRSDALALGQQAITRLLLALAAGVALAMALGVVVARRIARPLRETAVATRALAAGQRNVTAPVRGPAEVAELAAGVNALSLALAQSEARQREFLLSVSHDLRTPLTAICGYAESLAGGVIPPEEAASAGAVMLTESQRLSRMVSDLLDLARLDARQLDVELLNVDLVEVARGAAPVWQMRCSAGGTEFRLELPTAAVVVHTDPARLRQVLDGLFDNALRVTPAGAPIVLAVSSTGDCGVVEVRDGGPGLTEADLDVAFERAALYRRYRGVRQVGTGLGLAIVHSIVTRLGGRVEAGHAPEGGARFTVLLPRRPAPSADEKPATGG